MQLYACARQKAIGIFCGVFGKKNKKTAALLFSQSGAF